MRGKGKRERREQKRREAKQSIDLLFHLFMHSLVDSLMCLDWTSNQKPKTLVYQDNTLTN